MLVHAGGWGADALSVKHDCCKLQHYRATLFARPGDRATVSRLCVQAMGRADDRHSDAALPACRYQAFATRPPTSQRPSYALASHFRLQIIVSMRAPVFLALAACAAIAGLAHAQHSSLRAR
jgi:hypothetical protein